MPSGIYKRTKENTKNMGLSYSITPKRLETLKKMASINKGKKRVFSKEWKENIGKSRVYPKGENSPVWKGGYENRLYLNNQRRVRKLGNGGSHTLGEWEHLKALYQWTCPACKKKEPEIVLSRDHITPLSFSGTDNIENIQPLCRGCNSKKKDKIIPKY